MDKQKAIMIVKGEADKFFEQPPCLEKCRSWLLSGFIGGVAAVMVMDILTSNSIMFSDILPKQGEPLLLDKTSLMKGVFYAWKADGTSKQKILP